MLGGETEAWTCVYELIQHFVTHKTSCPTERTNEDTNRRRVAGENDRPRMTKLIGYLDSQRQNHHPCPHSGSPPPNMSTDTPHPAPGPITKTPAEITASINPSPRRRLAIILSFPLLILLAVPFWWCTTSIERLPLPETRISALEGANVGITMKPSCG